MEGVYAVNSHLATENLVKGEQVYGERLLHFEGKELRAWDPYRSKVAAAVKKGLKQLNIGKGSRILYLGAAEGTTISHLSDIIGLKGIVFGVDVSARSMRKFVYLCEKRKNLVPILADASQPNIYKEYLEGFSIDALFQDVSQKNQADIFLKNTRVYLKRGGFGFLSVKARSINSAMPVEEIVQEETEKLENEFDILGVLPLQPFEKDHAMVYCRKK